MIPPPPAADAFLTTGGLSAHGIVPRFDLARAKQLLETGRRPDEVIAAAERLGDGGLKRSLLAHLRARA